MKFNPQITQITQIFQKDGAKRYHQSTINNQQSSIQSGFTLIEVVIFIVVAGVIASTIFIPFMTSLKGSMFPEKVATATYLAQYKMEEFTKYTYNNSNLDPIELTTYADVDSINFPNYQWQWDISYVYEDLDNPQYVDDTEYKLILVRVKDPDGSEIVLQTVVTRG